MVQGFRDHGRSCEQGGSRFRYDEGLPIADHSQDYPTMNGCYLRAQVRNHDPSGGESSRAASWLNRYFFIGFAGRLASFLTIHLERFRQCFA